MSALADAPVSPALARALRDVPRARVDADELARGTDAWILAHRHEWGAGLTTATNRGLRVRGFVDPRRVPRTPRFAGRPVIPLRFAGGLTGAIVVAGAPKKGWFDGSYAAASRAYWLELPERAGRTRPDATLASQAEAISEVFGHLQDDESRASYAACLRARASGDPAYYRIAPYPEYSHPLARPPRGGVALDIGACYGHTSRRFRWQVGPLGRVIAFEPIPSNFERVRKLRYLGVEARPYAASDAPGTARMSDAGGSSRIGAKGAEVEVELCPVDKFVRDEGLQRVDLIKYDVEGHERPALAGSMETLARHRPILHLSIYHLRQDLYELPQWVLRELSDYALFVGHHSYYRMETDLYAVPRERLGQR